MFAPISLYFSPHFPLLSLPVVAILSISNLSVSSSVYKWDHAGLVSPCLLYFTYGNNLNLPQFTKINVKQINDKYKTWNNDCIRRYTSEQGNGKDVLDNIYSRGVGDVQTYTNWTLIRYESALTETTWQKKRASLPQVENSTNLWIQT